MYYGFQFWSGRNTTTGNPNPSTGRMSKAGNLEIFSTKAERDEWVDDGKSTADMGGNCRESVTRKQARELCLGLTVAEFDEQTASTSFARYPM